MSDPASLALSVLPLMVGAAETYRRVYDRIYLFRHSTREIRRVQRSLFCQKEAYTLECQLLLRLVLPDDVTIGQMLDNTAHALWADRRLNEELARCLNRGLNACCIAIESVRDRIKELEDEMKCFDEADRLRGQGDTIRQAKSRIKSKLKITFDKARFDKAIANLRECNEDLSKLRSQISELQSPANLQQTRLISQQKICREISAVRQTSQALHGALASCWSCTDPTHGDHSAKLYIEAKVKDYVQLDIAISYRTQQCNIQGCKEHPIRLYVRSESPNFLPSIPFHVGPSELRTLLRTEKQGNTSTSTTSTSKRLRSQVDSDERPPKRRCVTSVAPNPSNEPSASAQTLRNIGNLNDSESLCHLLCASTMPFQDCLGYLETPSHFRHVFYSSISAASSAPIAQGLHDEAIIGIDELLQQAALDDLSILDRLKLAHRIATAVLQYHDTPWLSQHWEVQSFAFFGSHTNISDTALQTLHLASYFPGNAQGLNVADQNPQIQPANDDYEEARLERGIENITLWSLGTALLQIAYWRPMDSTDVRNVRKSAGRVSKWIGPRFQKIVEKCIRCDFGYGSNLDETPLQSAVYDGVVCELEALIAKLDISAD